uniref:Uncharacterized protein n=1 Tax=Anopheles coluzzii TaxID=1518534 RepID=A0A8W7PBD1_ANOCL
MSGMKLSTQKQKICFSRTVMHHRFPQFTWIDFQSRDVIVQYLHPVLQLVDPAPRRRHRQRQYDERVREVLFVQGELEQIVVARIAVQNPNAEARDICKLATFKKRRPERRPPTILTVPILVPHVDAYSRPEPFFGSSTPCSFAISVVLPLALSPSTSTDLFDGSFVLLCVCTSLRMDDLRYQQPIIN